MGRGTRAVRIALVAALGILLACGRSPADEPKPAEPVPGLPAAEGKARLARLQSRVTEWWNARKRLVHACYQCNGRGSVRWGRVWNACPGCKGRKRVLDAKVYRTLHYEMKTEAFRLIDGIRDRLEAQYDRESTGELPIDIDRFKIERTEFADAEHAEAFIVENKDSVARPQRWVFVGKEWFVWDALAQQGWPGESSAAAALPEMPKGSPLEPAQRTDLDAALGGVNLLHELSAAQSSDTVLMLAFARKKGVAASEARGAVAQEGVSVVRAIFAPHPRWTAIHVVWMTEWRDRLGQVETRPYALAYIDRPTFDKVVWGNLAESERPGVLRWETRSYDGLVPWE